MGGYTKETETHGLSWLSRSANEGSTTGFTGSDWGSAATQKAINSAAANGHLSVVKFLISNRTEGFSSQAIDSAASNGYLEIVKYLNGLPDSSCTKSAVDQAIMNKHTDIAKYLLENRTEGCSNVAILNAIFNNDIEALDVLYSSPLSRKEIAIQDSIALSSVYGHDLLRDYLVTKSVTPSQ
ncbi:hypothetical protein PPL_10343 [Heterostelium album PN500]|uniref:Ankyrin repeat protein n=1 Tax=Heterostelium pallidum (strain ATCC 26659 / Pp 5 / PN500) TaxID=670386 RepID=D3BQ23_HETP5|nr:hypothetical protein PPL_10343 [Heterostelium album PN500]EFA76574.1 hypothetical protein PPL_10343 [Heterostelium album PN500]|eukprot:XP_020428706.1 hypothetical protein PPL_10343 [Heterostelium album PN500]